MVLKNKTLSAAPASSYSRVLHSNDKVRVAVMGTVSRGNSLAESFSRLEGSEVVYLCDVDRRAVEKTQNNVQKHQGTVPKGTNDLRHVLDDAEVDALVIAAPDHWHVPAALLAVKAGKHVYLEKPASHNPREGELLVEAAHKYGKIVQVGNQRRSYPRIVEGIQALHDGIIGDVYYARSSYHANRGPIGKGKEAPVPDWLDYELWQGPAPRRPYRDNLIHYNWHWFWHWGTAESCNNGVHPIDLCRWGLRVDFPTSVASAGGRYWYRGADDWETPDTQVIMLDFEGSKGIKWEGLSSGYPGPTFHGEKGTLVLTDDGFSVFDQNNKEVKKISDGTSGPVDLTGPGFARDTPHLVNFLEAVRGVAKANSPIEEGHKSTLLCLLANISLRTGRTLRCSPQNGHILGDAEAMRLWGREYEPGWWVPTV
jgi:predicted dehydrogenase